MPVDLSVVKKNHQIKKIHCDSSIHLGATNYDKSQTDVLSNIKCWFQTKKRKFF